MGIDLKAKLNGFKISEFEFINFVKHVSSVDPEAAPDTDANVYFRFELEDLRPFVEGSQFENNGSTMVPIVAADVKYVNCNLDLIEEANGFEFDFDEDGNFKMTGRYKGDMFLDVARRSNEVWLVKTKFIKLSRDYKAGKRKEVFNTFMTRYNASKGIMGNQDVK